MLEDIRAASSSVHVNQFGFRPGIVGDTFADALIAKAAEGVAVRVVVDGGARTGARCTRPLRATLPPASGLRGRARRSVRAQSGQLGGGGANRAGTSAALGHVDHRKLTSSTAAPAGSAAPASRTISGTAASTTCSCASPGRSSRQLQLVFVASVRWLGGRFRPRRRRPVPCARGGWGAPAGAGCCTTRPDGSGRSPPIARLLERATETLDVVNPYVTDRGMIRGVEAAERGVRVRLFVPANANNWACAAASSTTTGASSMRGADPRVPRDAPREGIRSRRRGGDRGNVQPGRWSLRRFFEIDLLLRSGDVAAQFEERFSGPAEAVSRPGQPLVGTTRRLKATALARLSPLLEAGPAWGSAALHRWPFVRSAASTIGGHGDRPGRERASRVAWEAGCPPTGRVTGSPCLRDAGGCRAEARPSRLPHLPRWGTVSRLNWRVTLVQFLANAVVIGVLIVVLPGFELRAATGCSRCCGWRSSSGSELFVRPALEFVLLPYLLQSLGLVVVVFHAVCLASRADVGARDQGRGRAFAGPFSQGSWACSWRACSASRRPSWTMRWPGPSARSARSGSRASRSGCG